MYKDVGKRILAGLLSLAMVLGMTDFSVLTVHAADAVTDISTAETVLTTTWDVYNGKRQTPGVKVDGITLTEGTDYIAEYKNADGSVADDMTSAGEKTIIVTGQGDYTGTVTFNAENKNGYVIEQRDITQNNSITIMVEPQEYDQDSIPIIPDPADVTVYDAIIGTNNGLLTYGVDYTFTCSENSGVTDAAVITIQGMGNYMGKKNATYVIQKKQIAATTIEGIADMEYDGRVDTGYVPAAIVVKDAAGDVVSEDNYTITYSYANGVTIAPETILYPGTVEVTITGQNEYEGSVTKTYSICKDIKAYTGDLQVGIESATGEIENIPNQTYTGAAITVSDLVVYDTSAGQTKKLVEGIDYSLEYKNNVAAESASIGIIGKGNYTNRKTVYFNILQAALTPSNAQINVKDECVYNGEAQKPAIDVFFNQGASPLVAGTDYEVLTENSYTNNVNAGTGTVTVKGKGNLTGSVSANFTIKAKSLADNIGGTISIELVAGSYKYDGEIPELLVSYNTTNGKTLKLEKGTDYTVTGFSVDKTGDEKLILSITITGKGNYSSSITKEIQVGKLDISGAAFSVEGVADGNEPVFTYTGEGITFNNKISVVYDGQELTPGTDYTLEYANNTDVTSDVKATVTIKGKGNYYGSKTISFQIVSMSIEDEANFRFAYEKEFTFDFQEHKPEITIRHFVNPQYRTLELGKDYTVRYENATNAGTGKIIITGIGNYEGQIEKTYTINPMDLQQNQQKFSIQWKDAYYINECYGATGNEIIPDGYLLIYTAADGSEIEVNSGCVYTFANNIHPGQADIIITGGENGNFTGSITKHFNIKGDLADEDQVVIANIASKVYTGETVTLENKDITITYRGAALTLGKDYTLEYENNTDAGTATVKFIPAKDSYYYLSGTALTKNFVIEKKDMADADVLVDAIPTEAYTYNGTPIYPELSIEYNGVSLTEITEENPNGDYTVLKEESNCTEAGNGKTEETQRYIVIQGNNKNFTGTRKINFVINPIMITEDTISVENWEDLKVQNYPPAEPGTEITLGEMVVNYADDQLSFADITTEISYNGDNSDIGPATVTITGTGNFAGSVTKEYSIKGSLADTTITVKTSTKEYTGQPIEILAEDIEVTYAYGEEPLVYGKDFVIEYNCTDEERTNVTGAPVSFKIVPAEGSYYLGEATGEEAVFTVVPKEFSLEMVTNLEEIQAGYDFTGSAIKPLPIIMNGEESVVQDADYTIDWANTTNVVANWDDDEAWENTENRPTITITAAGANYTGSLEIPFKIYPLAVDAQTEEGTDKLVAKTGEISVGDYAEDYAGQPVELENVVISYMTSGEDTLGMTPDTDYTISYRNNTAAGTAQLVIAGKGNYTGEKIIEFLIKGKLNDIYASVEDVPAQPYSKAGATPDVMITYGTEDNKRTLEASTDEGITGDYILSYKNHYNVATKDAAEPPTVIVTGINAFEGSVLEIPFEIMVRDFEKYADGIVLEGLAESYTYTGNAIVPDKAMLSLIDNGEEVDADQYEIVGCKNNTNVASADGTNAPYIEIRGKGNYTGTLRFTFAIIPVNVSDTTKIAVNTVTDQVYTGNEITPGVVVTLKGTNITLKAGTDYTLTWGNNVNVATAADKKPTITIQGKGNYTGTRVVNFNITPLSLSDADCQINVSSQAYTGNAVIPKVTITRNGVALIEGRDFKVSAGSNNVNVCTNATVKITGMGNYTGTITKTFTITAKSIGASDVSVTGVEDKVFNTKAQTQNPVITAGGKTLKLGTDYTITYKNNVNAGTATMIITGKGNYSGSRTVTFKISVRSLSDSGISVAAIANQVYNGKALTPSPVVTYTDKTQGVSYTLVAGKDYTVTYKNNNSVGTNVATVTIKGSGNYTGTITKSFTIVGNIALATVKTVADQTYTGKAITPKVTVTLAGKTLVEGTDYTLTYQNNTEPGKGTIIITGKGAALGGTKTVSFNIVRDISGGLVIVGLADTYLYTGNSIVPNLGKVVAYGKVLTRDVDYKVTLTNNINVGTATLKVEGIGIYRGSKTETFEIVRRSIAQCTISGISTATYNGKPITPEPVIKYGNTTLVEGTDYSVVYENNLVPGTGKIIIQGMGDFDGNITKYFSITIPKAGGLRATAQANGQVQLYWTAQKAVNGYQIYDNNNKKLTQSGGNSAIISGHRMGNSYYYKVRAYVVVDGRTYYGAFSDMTKLVYPKYGLCKASDGNWYYYENDKINTNYTGIVNSTYGWWYVKNGKLDTSYTGLTNSAYGWWYVKNGKLDTSYTGLANSVYGWWYVKNGRLDTSYTGLANSAYGWWYVQNGKLNTSATGLTYYGGSWWYVQNGKLNTSATGLTYYGGSWWYVQSGKVNFNKTGLVSYGGSWWYVQGGKVNFNKTGLVQYGSNWWYVKNGKVDTSFAGFTQNQQGVWYVQNGKVDHSYIG